MTPAQYRDRAPERVRAMPERSAGRLEPPFAILAAPAFDGLG